jgi:hypothetical protein
LAAGIFKRPQLCPERIFDLSCVDFSQAVLGAKDPMCPDGRFLRGGDCLELRHKPVAQGGRCLGAEDRLCGVRDDFRAAARNAFTAVQPSPRGNLQDENMDEGWPKIKARNTKRVSPWMAIIEREVEFAPGAGELYLGISCRAHRSGRGCGRVLPPRTHGGDWLCLPFSACARVLCALHRAVVEPRSFILCRDRSQRRGQTNRAGNRTKAGKSRAIGMVDSRRRICPAAPHWSRSTRGPARLYRPRRLPEHSKGCMTLIKAPPWKSAQARRSPALCRLGITEHFHFLPIVPLHWT